MMEDKDCDWLEADPTLIWHILVMPALNETPVGREGIVRHHSTGDRKRYNLYYLMLSVNATYETLNHRPRPT
jgi:hypothetical protein